MKRFYFLIGAVILAAVLVGMRHLAIPAIAARPMPIPASDRMASPSSPLADYLVVLPVVPPDPTDVPPNLTPEQAAEYARSITQRQAQPILNELERLRAEGRIAGFEVRPDLHGVAVRGAAPEVTDILSLLPGVTGVTAYADDSPPTCAVEAARALPEQVLGLSRVAAGPAGGVQAADIGIQATDPSIDAYVEPGSSGDRWTEVSGQTTPNTSVTLRILRAGQVIATQSTTSSSGGSYYFHPSWHSCPTYGYDWALRPGDVVEVTAHGNTVSTVVAPLSAWVDPVANTVAGKTDPGRSVQVSVSYPSGDPCSWYGQSKTVGTDAGGNFSANFTGQVDFDRRAYSDVYARDGNGNSTYYGFDAYRISASFNSSSFGGNLKPEGDFTATLSRAGSIVSTYRGRSSASNYYYGWFTDTIRAGDVVRVSGGGVSVQYTATDLHVTLDRTTNRATGTTGANRLVEATFYKSTGGYVPTSCSWDSDCAAARANGSGEFAMDTEVDLVRGDFAYFYVYDAEGNYQYGERAVPAIVADLTWAEVSGYWSDPGAGSVTVTLKDSGGAVKDTQSSVWVDSYDGEFSTWMGSTIIPTDRIEVTDGVVAETMTVQNLTARLDGGTGHLTGSGYNGHLLARLYDFRRDSGYWYGYCVETTVTGGTYNMSFSGAQVGGQDAADVWSAGPNGHYTHRYPSAFTVNAQKGDDTVNGYSETPNVLVTVTLKRNGSPIAVYSTTSLDNGYYYGGLSDGTPVTITPGDIVQVQTGDGDSVSLTIPELTVNADATNNRIYGRSPAREPVRPQVQRWLNWGWYSYSQNTTADASGNYRADFDGLYWSRDCSAVDVDHRCAQPAVYYYNAAGHQIWLEGPQPSPVSTDIYENDDTPTTASGYAGIQFHTFHATTDTDWVKFTVPGTDVTNNVPYRIETSNLGWGMATRARLYDAGMNLQGEWWGYEYRGRGISVLWTPTTSGTYYLEVSPPSSDYAAYCDAVYDLLILPVRAQVFLPLVMRDY